MKPFHKTVKLTANGKFKIPRELLKRFNINPMDEVSISIKGKEIHIERYKPVCEVTGETSENLIELLPNFYVSKEGMEILLKEIREKRI